ncbi:MAG: hypothetical protein ACRDTJ_05690 [Pseudonocardiaceae bacterium]
MLGVGVAGLVLGLSGCGPFDRDAALEKDLLKMAGVEAVDVDDRRVEFSDVKESDLKPVADRIAEWEDDGGLATRLNGWDLTSNGVVVGSDVAQQHCPTTPLPRSWSWQVWTLIDTPLKRSSRLAREGSMTRSGYH